jgi:hypothetical protein
MGAVRSLVGRMRQAPTGEMSRTGFCGALESRMLFWGEEILRCHVETEEYPARESWKERWQIGKASSTVKGKDEAWPRVQALEAVPLAKLTPALLEDTIAGASRVAPRQAQIALGTVKQILRDAIKRGQQVDPALLLVKAPGHEEREPFFPDRH